MQGERVPESAAISRSLAVIPSSFSPLYRSMSLCTPPRIGKKEKTTSVPLPTETERRGAPCRIDGTGAEYAVLHAATACRPSRHQQL